MQSISKGRMKRISDLRAELIYAERKYTASGVPTSYLTALHNLAAELTFALEELTITLDELSDGAPS